MTERNVGLHWCLRVSGLLALAIVITGCFGDGVAKDTVAAGEVGLQEASQLVDSGQYSQARPLLDKCIKDGGLNADLLAKALVLRARCHIDASNTEAAEQDLEHALQGSPPMEQYHLAKGLLLRKLGKTQEASAEIAKAKRIAPKLKVPNA